MSNVAGKAYGMNVITPMRPYLTWINRFVFMVARALPDTLGGLLGLSIIHFARWVIVRDWVNSRAQPRQDHLGCPYLIFTSNLHGSIDTYLDALCARAEAAAIWNHCVGAPQPASGAALKAYLLHNQIDTGFFVAAYPDASVEEVRASLALREQLIAFLLKHHPEALPRARSETVGAPPKPSPGPLPEARQ